MATKLVCDQCGNEARPDDVEWAGTELLANYPDWWNLMQEPAHHGKSWRFCSLKCLAAWAKKGAVAGEERVIYSGTDVAGFLAGHLWKHPECNVRMVQ